MTVNLMVKDCKNATEKKTVKLLTVSSTTIYDEKIILDITCNFTVVYRFGSEKECIIYSE